MMLHFEKKADDTDAICVYIKWFWKMIIPNIQVEDAKNIL